MWHQAILFFLLFLFTLSQCRSLGTGCTHTIPAVTTWFSNRLNVSIAKSFYVPGFLYVIAPFSPYSTYRDL